MHEWGYAVELAWRGLRKSPGITVLSVLALALGMGATITAYSVTRLLAGNPLPSRAHSLYQVQLDSSGLAPYGLAAQFYGPHAMTWLDVKQLEAARPKVPQTAVVNTGSLNINKAAGSGGAAVAKVRGLEVQSAFFRMFDVPLVAGHGWAHDDDVNAAPVAVIAQTLARKLFGGADKAIGQTFQIGGKPFRVVGVSGHWKPYPHFYGLTYCTYACEAEQLFIPISTARAQGVSLFQIIFVSGGNFACNRQAGGVSAAKCPYLGFWASLPTAAARSSYRTTLAHYASSQKATGRLKHGGMQATALASIGAILNAHHVVPFSVRFGVWVALVFLLVCLANVAGLLLTRFMRGAVELGIRRALGATRGAVFAQCLLEASLVGLVGGALALPLVWLGLWLVKHQPTAYASVIALDWQACVELLVLAIICGAVIGIVPAWRAAVVDPGLQVKEQ